MPSIALLALALLGGTAQAATFTWDGNGGAGGNDWSVAGNWTVAGVPDPLGTGTNDLHFAGAIKLTPNMEASYNLNSLVFDSGASSFILTSSAGTTLTIQAGITNNDNSPQIVSITNILLGAAQTWGAVSGALTVTGDIDNNGTLLTIAATVATSLSGAISGTGGLTKIGTSTLTLSGSSVNTYTGTTTVSAGTLTLAKSAGVNAFGGDLAISGGTVDYSTLDNQIPDAGNVTLSSGTFALGARTETIGQTSVAGSFTMSGGNLTIGSGTLNLNRNPKITGGTVTITAASGKMVANQDLIFGSGLIDLSSGADLNLRGGSGTGMTYESSGTSTAQITGASGSVSLNTAASSTTVFNIADSASVATEMSIAAIIAGGTAGLEKTGTGVLSLSGTNTYTVATTISAGKVRVQNNAALGTTGSGTTVASGAAIQIDGSGLVVSENITSLIGDGDGNGALENLSAANNWSGTIAFDTGGARINSTAGTLTLSGATISGNGYAMTYGGAGNITISSIISGTGSPLTYDGGGTLTLSGANTYSGDTTVIAGTLKLGANDVIPNGSGKGNVSVSGILDLAGFSQTINGLSGGGTVNNSTGSGSLTAGNNNASSTFGGVISGAVAFNKTGTGTLTLSGNNTYTGGTTLSGGTLSLGANTVIPDSGTFTFAGGIVAANNRSDYIGALSLTASSVIDFSADASPGYLSFNGGPVSVGGGITLTINNWTGSAFLSGTDDRLYLRDGSDSPISASQSFLDSIRFTGFADGAFWISGTGEIVPVPEPINVALGVFGAVFVVFGIGRRLCARARRPGVEG